MARISNSVFIDGVAKFKKNLVNIKKRVGKLLRSCISIDQDDHFDLASPPIAALDVSEALVNGPAVADTDATVHVDKAAADAPTVADTDATVHVDKPAADAPESVPEFSVIRRLYDVLFNAKSQVFIYRTVWCRGSDRYGRDKIRSADEISFMLSDINSNPEIVDQVEKISVFRVGDQAKTRAFHAFVVFQTKSFSYSVERFSSGICMQRSKKNEDVCCSFYDWSDGGLRETEWVNGKGTVGDVIRTLIAEENVLSETFNIFTRNCQCFAALVFQKFNSEGKTFRRYRKYTPIAESSSLV